MVYVLGCLVVGLGGAMVALGLGYLTVVALGEIKAVVGATGWMTPRGFATMGEHIPPYSSVV